MSFLFDPITTVRPLSIAGIAIRLFLAMVIGGLIGIERGFKSQPAGMRTHMLVTLGSTVVMMTNQFLFQIYQSGDPARLGAQVISGIGFLGAGTIMVTNRNRIKGLTTAAGLWTGACTGLAIGVGLYEVALIATAAIWVALVVMSKFDILIHSVSPRVDLYIEIDGNITPGSLMHAMRLQNLNVSNIQLAHEDTAESEAGVTCFTLSCKALDGQKHDEIVKMVGALDGVRYVQMA